MQAHFALRASQINKSLKTVSQTVKKEKEAVHDWFLKESLVLGTAI